MDKQVKIDGMGVFHQVHFLPLCIQNMNIFENGSRTLIGQLHNIHYCVNADVLSML